MIKTIFFDIIFQSEVIFSERTATLGDHQTLDYVPGSALLGMSASSLYAILKDVAFDVYHSGKVRFGNAYPLSESGEPSLPIPLSWRYGKGTSLTDDTGRLTALVDCGALDAIGRKKMREEGKQLKDIRSGYFTSSGCYLLPDTRVRMKSATDRDEGQLFTYQSLAAGSRWRFSLRVDSSIDKNTEEKIRNSLLGNHRLGRSRSAEYGSVSITESPAQVECDWGLADNSEFLTLYCASDICVRQNQTGAYSLVPDFDLLGIKGASIVREKSFIRKRFFQPFNSKRSSHDLTREVILKGSVITLKHDAGTPRALRGRVEQRIGLYRQEGLGHIMVNPSFLNGKPEEFFAKNKQQDFETPENSCDGAPVEATSILTRWAMSKGARLQATGTSGDLAAQWHLQLLLLLDAAESATGNIFPSASQWRAVFTTLSAVTSDDSAIEKQLFEPEGMCVTGVSSAQWKKPHPIDGSKISFVSRLKNLYTKAKDETPIKLTALRLVAEMMAHSVNERMGGRIR